MKPSRHSSSRAVNLHGSLPKVPAEQAFIVTIGVPHDDTQSHCRRALQALERAGFHAGATSTGSIKQIAELAELVDGIAQFDYTPPTEGEAV